VTRPEGRLRGLTLLFLLAHGAWAAQVVVGILQADVTTEAAWWRRSWLVGGTAAGLLLLTLPAAVLYLRGARPRLAFGLSAVPVGALLVLLVVVVAAP
jgi:hypothetical protein